MTSSARNEGGGARVERPLFSIITSSYNQADFLEATIRSVRDQGRPDVEHIIMDGGSTDGSVDILREYDDVLAYWVSARDGGQPAAWNAGVRKARGQLFGFLNSDDLYLPGGLDEIARLADAHPDADWLLGGTLFFGPGSEGRWYPGAAPQTASDVLYQQVYVPQPGHFWRRSLMERVGDVDETLQFSFDLDYLVRCMLAGAKAAATERMVAAFRMHGESKTLTMQDVQRKDTAAIEDRYFAEIERREGARVHEARARQATR
jgi:glycosyltransferase involved in cell wall biosynthesis